MKPFFFFLCFLFLFGCEKATKYNSSPRDNFEALWRIMVQNMQAALLETSQVLTSATVMQRAM